MRALVVVVALAAGTSSCTLLWLLTNDPEGLPCDFSTSDTGACLDGYTCVKLDTGDSVCLKAGKKKAGDACAKTAECGEQLVCASAYGSCLNGADDPNCDLVDDAAKNLACRPVCDINTQNSCGADQRCFELTSVAGINGFCESGVCTTDSDCGSVPGGGLCDGEAILGGQTGFCFEVCDPLACDPATRTCPDCTGLDAVVDEGTNCVPPRDPNEVLTAGRTICDIAGGLAAFAPCGVGADTCTFGTACVNFNGAALCRPWCTFPTGAPACDATATCTQVTAGNTLGICIEN